MSSEGRKWRKQMLPVKVQPERKGEKEVRNEKPRGEVGRKLGSAAGETRAEVKALLDEVHRAIDEYRSSGVIMLTQELLIEKVGMLYEKVLLERFFP